jgi:hypothetical protein
MKFEKMYSFLNFLSSNSKKTISPTNENTPRGLPTTLGGRYHLSTTKKMFLVSTGNLFLMSAMLKDMICEIKKSSIFTVGCHGPTKKVVSLVSAAYVSRHQKSKF